MAINKLSIKRFTVFDKIEFDFCDGINVFIGENGTGKTHLLKIIYAICGCERLESTENKKTQDFNEKIRACFQTKDLAKLTSNHVDDITRSKNTIIEAFIDDNKHHYQFVIKQTGEFAGTAYIPKFKGAIPVVFIPAKEMLTHARLEKDFLVRDVPFDITLIDILIKAGVSTLKHLPENISAVLDRIAQIIDGKVVYNNDRYFIQKQNGSLIEFAVEAEGFKKLGLIYRLIETGYLNKGSVLIWDEPEANMNPKLIPVIVEILLELSLYGVQVFIATHEYNLMKYFSVKKNGNGDVAFFSLHKTENGVACEKEEDYDLLEHNAIIDANTKLLEDEIERIL